MLARMEHVERVINSVWNRQGTMMLVACVDQADSGVNSSWNSVWNRKKVGVTRMKQEECGTVKVRGSQGYEMWGQKDLEQASCRFGSSVGNSQNMSRQT